MSVATSIDACVACGSGRFAESERSNGYRLAACAECGMTFTLNPDYDAERYVDLYAASRGELAQPRLAYAAPERRLQLERLAYVVPSPQLTPAERRALRWVRAHAPRGAHIVDCGCGTGRFLRALAGAGFRATGVELATDLVAQLQAAGFDAIQGSAHDFEWSDAEPFAVTFFEVLEHLPEPARVLERLRERWPGAHLLVSVPSPRRVARLREGEPEPLDTPPNHFLRWTPDSLERFMRRLGYRDVEVVLPPPTGSELAPGLGRALGPAAVRRGLPSSAGRAGRRARLAATALLAAHRAYHMATEVVGAPAAAAWRRKGASAGSMLAIASP